MSDVTEQFDFQMDERERSSLLAEARKTVVGLNEVLGDERTGLAPSAAEQATLDLLRQFSEAVAQFSGFPDVIHLEEKHFAEHGLPVPQRFRDLSDKFRFYWLRFPTVLKPANGTNFNKLQCAVQFNPGEQDAHKLPRAALILPDRKFVQIAGADLNLDVHINENFEFEAKAGGVAGVDAKAAAGGGFIAGPFKYSFKRAVVDHTAPGAEKVFWTLQDSHFSENDDLAFIVVMQVPKEVEKVEVAAALQACHGFNVTANLGDLLQYFGRRLTSFFRAGAPTIARQVWNITPML